MTWKNAAVTGIAALVLTLGASGAAQADFGLVTNGGFEQTDNAFGPGDHKSFQTAAPTGWSGGNGLTFLCAPGTADDGSYLPVYTPFPNHSPDGGNFVEADGDPNYSGVLYQTITGLTAGQRFAVSFYQAAGQQAGFSGPTTEQWAVGLGSDLAASQANSQLSHQFQLAQGGVGQWEAQTLTFTADGTSDVLSFLAVGTPGGAPPISFLDGVSLRAVPEPSALLLSGLGLAGLGLAHLRRRAKSKTAAV